MVMKKGERFVANAEKVDILRGGTADGAYGNYPINIIRTDITEEWHFRSADQAELRGFAGFGGSLDQDGHALFAPVTTTGFIYGIEDKIIYPFPNIPTLKHHQTSEQYLNWRYLGSSWNHYHGASRTREQPLIMPSIGLKISHLWHQSEIVDVPEDVPRELIRSGEYFLVRGESTHVVESIPEGGKKERHLYILKELRSPLVREYIIQEDQALEFSHPGIRMCFENGYQRTCVFWRTGSGQWQKNTYC